MTDVTGLIPVMSSADSHDSTSHLLPAKVEVVVGRLIRRSFGWQPYKSPSINEEKSNWREERMSPHTKEREREMVHVVSP